MAGDSFYFCFANSRTVQEWEASPNRVPENFPSGVQRLSWKELGDKYTISKK
jgi:hypothetical protein